MSRSPQSPSCPEIPSRRERPERLCPHRWRTLTPHTRPAGRRCLAQLWRAARGSSWAHAFSDRLHEPYRGPLSPVYEPIRTELPAGAAGVTISGSGPTVIVWVDPPSSTRCAAELAERFPDATVLTLPVAVTGAARI